MAAVVPSNPDRESDDPEDRERDRERDDRRQAMQTIRSRSAPGLVTYPLSCVLLGLTSSFGSAHSRLFVATTAAAILVSLLRLVVILRFRTLRPVGPRLYDGLFIAGVFAAISLWNLLAGIAVALYSTTWIGVLALLISAGVASAGAIAYSPVRWLARSFLGYMLVVQLVALVYVGNREALGLAVMMVSYFGYLWAQISGLHREYWSGLRSARLLEQRAEDLERARHAAEAADRVKSQFLANMSHEIRTPLNGIIGLNELALGTALDTTQRGYLDAVHQSAELLLAIVDDVLDFSKMEAGKLQLEAIDLDLADIVHQTETLFRPRAEAKGLDFIVEVAPQLAGTAVRGDPVRLLQVLGNLIGNAIKFTARGRVTVRCSLDPENDSRGGTTVVPRFEVIDTGMGISPEGRERLFRSFSQVDASMTRKHGGTGLGLAICRHLVTSMGGEIAVDSEPGQGSTFWFTAALELGDPAAVVRRAPSPSPSLSPSPPRPSGEPVTDASGAAEDLARLASMTILAADDSSVNRMVLSEMLRRLGCSFELVENGALAVEAWNRQRPAVILMDCQMPEMDGFAAVRAIRSQETAPERTPIIALTAHAMPGDRERCLAAGMDDYLTKPLRLEALGRALARWCPAPVDPASRPVIEPGSTEMDETGSYRLRAVQSLRCDYGDAAFAELVEVFQRTTPEHLDRLRRALEDQDLEAIRFEAHYLKGTAATLGATTMAEQCVRIELLAEGEESPDLAQLGELTAELIAKAELTVAALGDVV